MGKHRLGQQPAVHIETPFRDDGANTDYYVAATDSIGSASTGEALSNFASYNTGTVRLIGCVASHLLDRLDTMVGAAADLVPSAPSSARHRA